MVDFIVAPIAIFVLFGGWLLVQDISRKFAKRHPEFGPYREEGSGCGGGCHNCSDRKADCENQML